MDLEALSKMCIRDSRYIEGIGFEEITKREDELTALAMEEMKKNCLLYTSRCV